MLAAAGEKHVKTVVTLVVMRVVLLAAWVAARMTSVFISAAAALAVPSLAALDV